MGARRLLSVLIASAVLLPVLIGGQSGDSITSYQLVRETRVTRTHSDFEYRAVLLNAGADASGGSATLASLSASTVVRDGAVSFGAVGAKATAVSLDTFIIRHDRTVTLNPLSLQWSITMQRASNVAPVVDAGGDLAVTLPAAVSLNGTASDDRLPAESTLTTQWSKVSGPGTVMFGNASAATTTAAFSAAGTYVLRLTASDGTLSTFDEMTITALPANQPPVARIEGLPAIFVGQQVALSAAASNDPEGEALTYTWSLISRPAGSAAALESSNEVTTSFVPDRPGEYRTRLEVSDGLLAAVTEFTRTTTNTPPVANAGADQSSGVGTTITLNGSASTDPDGDELSYRWRLIAPPPGTVSSLANPAAVAPAFVIDVPGTFTFELIVTDFTGAESVPDQVNISAVSEALPPPPLEGEAAASFIRGIDFLFSGDNPVQSGVVPGTIEAPRVAVIRGRVVNREGTPVGGVRISVPRSPAFGHSLSRADGTFDLAINGGGAVTIRYEANGYLSADRLLQTPWEDYVVAPDVALVQLDPVSTRVTLDVDAPTQVARGSSVTDEHGRRQATLIVPSGGVLANLELPDGTVVPALSALHLRATEYTVGPSGPNAMPASLPPTTGYTYAVELSADEAIRAGATRVTFDRPLAFYLENFLLFPVGGIVPSGFYDRTAERWVPSTNGRIVAVLAEANGVATLDISGQGQPASSASLAELGITGEELRQVASLYEPGASLWRVPISHFTPWDFNWPYGPPLDAVAPGLRPLDQFPSNHRFTRDPGIQCGSIIECENQVLRESIPVVGTPYALSYRSDRVLGASNTRLDIPLTGVSVPASLRRVDLTIMVAGRTFRETFAAAANLVHSFEWDGRDAYYRLVPGFTRATVRVEHVYPAQYQQPSTFAMSFGQLSGTPIGVNARQEIVLANEQQWTFRRPDARSAGLGGWTLDVHHSFDARGGELQRGDGSREQVDPAREGLTRIAGMGAYEPLAVDQLARETNVLDAADGMAVGPDGTLYFAETFAARIRKIDPAGMMRRFVGFGGHGYAGDGQPAERALVQYPRGLAVATDGSVYFADQGNNVVRRVRRDGIIETVAGNGTAGYSGDGALAVNAQLNSPRAVALAPDGTIYIADYGNARIRRVSQGIITTIAGDGTQGDTGDGGRASTARVSPMEIVGGPDGSIYFINGDPYRGFVFTIRRIAPDGRIARFGPSGWAPFSIAVGRDGTVYASDAEHVRHVRPDATTTIAGTPGGCHPTPLPRISDGTPARQVRLCPRTIAVGPDGRVYIFIAGWIYVMNTSPAGFKMASPDGAREFSFEGGLHRWTRSAFTGALEHAFDYTNGALTSVADARGLTTIRRDGRALPQAITGPFGQETLLQLDANGYLSGVSAPGGARHTFSYTADGLLTGMTDPAGNSYQFAYDGRGRLILHSDPVGGSRTLTRTDSSAAEVSVDTALGRSTTYSVRFDASGAERRQTTYPDGTVRSTLFALNGTQEVTTPDGMRTQVTFAPDPRFGGQAPVIASARVTAPSGLSMFATTTRSMVPASNAVGFSTLTETTTVNGRTTQTVFNAVTRTFTTTSPGGRASTVVLDLQGHVVQTQTGGLAAVQYTYDQNGRVSTVDQGGRLMRIGYDARGRVATTTDPLLGVRTFEFDDGGRLMSTTLRDATILGLGYDSNGNITSVTPPGRPPHRFEFGPGDLIASYSAPAAPLVSHTQYRFDVDQQLTAIDRPDRRLNEFGYDAAGRLSTVNYSRGVARYGYDAVGRLASLADPGGVSLAFAYDGALPLSETWSGTAAGVVSRTFTSNFEIASERVNGGLTVTFGYDADRLLTQAGDLALTRHPQHGGVTATSLGSTSESVQYNVFGEKSSYAARSGPSALLDFQYERDALGRITRVIETANGVSRGFDYGYDAGGRLLSVRRDGVTQSSYEYDTNGNRIAIDTPGGRTEATYDDQDRLVSYGDATFTYSAAGELASRTSAGQTATYQYDSFGNLIEVSISPSTTIRYVLDGRGRRVGRSVNSVRTATWLYSDQLRIAAELDGSGAVRSRFVYGTKPITPEYFVRAGVTYRIFSDHLGSPRIVINAITGAVMQQIDYDAWGNVLVDTNPGFQPFGFAGGLADPDTGLVHFGVREYDPRIGRWSSVDPILFGAGDANLYGYVHNDPVNWTDPTGLFAAKVVRTIFAFIIDDALGPQRTRRPGDPRGDPRGIEPPGGPGIPGIMPGAGARDVLSNAIAGAIVGAYVGGPYGAVIGCGGGAIQAIGTNWLMAWHKNRPAYTPSNAPGVTAPAGPASGAFGMSSLPGIGARAPFPFVIDGRP